MKRFFKAFAAIVLFALSLTACEKEIPIDDIWIKPASATMFVGETLNIDIQYTPLEATNIDEMEVYSTNESIITYSNGVVTAKDAGNAAISAACGNVVGQCKVKVYRDKFQKGNETFGIDYASGHLYRMGLASFQELDITLTHQGANGMTQNFKIWVTKEQLGKDLDFTQPLFGLPFVGVYMNNNEDGYLVYGSSEGTPMIVTADWSFTDVTLKRGILRVDNIQDYRFKVHADFELSNGYAFNTDWEGWVNMKEE